MNSETRLYLMYPVENNYLRSANLDRLQIMVGLKGNAKEKLDGSHLDTLKEGTAFLRARWLKCSDIFPAFTFVCSRFCTCMFYSRVVTNMRILPLTAFFFFFFDLPYSEISALCQLMYENLLYIYLFMYLGVLFILVD